MRRSMLVMMMLLSASLAVAGNLSPTQFLDERTGATVTVAREPWVFALERSIYAANARDYVSLTAVEVDRSGHLQVYLIGYLWSTIDRRGPDARTTSAESQLEIAADGRQIALKPEAHFPNEFVDDRQLGAPKSARLQRAAYLVSREVLQYLAASRQASISIAVGADADADPQDVDRETYESWQDGRRALRAFLEQISP